ncbi:MAG: nuclear transport factor 2 family protein [Actinomycetota bacterium]
MTAEVDGRTTTVRHTALAYLAALGGDDPDAVADLVTDDFVNEHQVTIAAGCAGRDAYRERLPGFFTDFAGRNYEVVGLVVDGERDLWSDGAPISGTACARYRFTAEVDAPDRPGGRATIDVPGVMWIDVEDGLVRRRIDTWDALHYFHQTGIAPPAAPAAD